MIIGILNKGLSYKNMADLFMGFSLSSTSEFFSTIKWIGADNQPPAMRVRVDFYSG